MQISSNFNNSNPYNLSSKENIEKFRENFTNLNAKELTNGYFLEFQNKAFNQTSINFDTQSALSLFDPQDINSKNLIQILNRIDYRSVGYDGKDITSLNQDEAKALISEDGFFGITNTANRIADFVLNGAGDDLEMLKAGREGVVNGFKEAERLWGGNLPEISQQTIQKTLEKIDERIVKLGGNIINVEA
ncbi:hydrogenase-4 component G [Campylobacter sp. RM16188]|uniref:hydrogenase-4 component G n=1 Tax=Campylobacter sp. RM16188 TaxID=1705725 RepID=UPI0015522181|nr:hydrogenase-4 component G [Campylobacter sp. RM16188]